MLGLGSFKVADVLVLVAVGSPPLPRPVVRLAFARCLASDEHATADRPSQSSPVQQHAAPSTQQGWRKSSEAVKAQADWQKHRG